MLARAASDTVFRDSLLAEGVQALVIGDLQQVSAPPA